ncbi:MAG: NAD-dependent epimerase/dehydratase family protein [Pseudomonadota bacterium]
MSHSILVTGGCGFVGSNLISLLDEGRVSIKVLDNLSNGTVDYLKAYPEVEIIEGDIRDFEAVKKASKGVDKIVHLAAYGSVVDSVADPATNFEINVSGTVNVLRAAVDNQIEKLVFSSTGGALIGNVEPPVSEESLPRPISPYGSSKLCGEAYCGAFSSSYGISVVVLRFANVYGPNSSHKKGVFNKFAQRTMLGGPLTIFGDGTSTRDYINVSDLCRGISLGLEHDNQGCEVFHIATGNETSLMELAELFLAQEGLDKSAISFEKTRVGEVERNFASYEKAKSVLGFEPKIGLADGVRDTYTYLKECYSN